MNFFNEENNKELMSIFQTESEEIADRIFSSLYSLEKTPENKELIANLYRSLHSLKGAVRMVGFSNIQTILHKMEDIFDSANEDKLKLDGELIKQLEKSLETAMDYIHKSIEKNSEVLGDEFNAIISNLEFISEVNAMGEVAPDLSMLGFDNETLNLDDLIGGINQEMDGSRSAKQQEQDSSEDENNAKSELNSEAVNMAFSNCFEIIDSIVPEEESPDIVILSEEIRKIYDDFKSSDLYEVKTALENIITKLDLVMSASNILTISEILEIRNELSSAVSKFSTSCIETVETGLTFFDVAEKISMLQGSSVYTTEIKDDIIQLKAGVHDDNILEIIDVLLDVLDFISENSVQLEEQMTQTMKSALEYCASPNESIDSELIVQQLEIMKQLLELNYKKDTDVSEIKNLSTQKYQGNNSSNVTEIKTLHVNAQKLDLLVNQLGELIITKIKTEKNLEKIDAIKLSNENCQKDLLKTSNYLRYYNRKYLQSGNSEQYTMAFVKQVFSLLSDITQNVSKTIYDLGSLYRSSKEDDIKMRLIIDEMESMVKNIRVLPVSTVFNSFTRMVRDIASEKGKEIDFEIEGNDTCADKKIIEEIKTPLIHILRNAIDHGIETKEDRINAGKDPVGKIRLSAKQDENKVVIEVMDDGRGFNLEKIKDRAVSRGFLTQEDVDSMTDEAIMNIIFWPGFTTGDSITSISGRGIGLDVVKTKISQLNGKVKVLSEFGRGSCVHIEIPVTLTTLRVFLVKISEQTFAIPIQVITTFIIKKQDEINNNNGVQSIVYNDKITPLYYLSDILQLERSPRDEKETILIVESDEKTVGLVVDKLLGDQDILQKKLSPPLYKVKNISGITNLASGELCLILNMQDIMHNDFNRAITTTVNSSKVLTNDILSYKRILTVDDSVTTRTMIKNILMNSGYVVDVVSDVEEALVKLKLNHYDLVITDIAMSKVNGYEFISTLKNDEMFADIPVMVLSAVSEEEAAKILKDYSIDYYISKENFNQTEFSHQVKAILTKYHV